MRCPLLALVLICLTSVDLFCREEFEMYCLNGTVDRLKGLLVNTFASWKEILLCFKVIVYFKENCILFKCI